MPIREMCDRRLEPFGTGFGFSVVRCVTLRLEGNRLPLGLLFSAPMSEL